MFSWSPSDYTRFDRERTLSAIDLVSRISGLRPRSVIDIGCGPGNSTEVLRRAFPDAEILGIDSSPEMVSQARERLPDVTFEVMDARGIPGDYDLIFSNSCIQWIDDHDTLIPWLMGRLEKHGTLAVQIPMNDTEPFRSYARRWPLCRCGTTPRGSHAGTEHSPRMTTTGSLPDARTLSRCGLRRTTMP